jgi:hypothetical protein
VHAADERMDPVDAGEPLGVPHHVARTGVTATGHDDEPLPAEVHHQGLVVTDQRIGLPPAIQKRIALEVEAGRSTMGNAIYRDIVQMSLLVDVDFAVVAVPVAYRYQSGGGPPPPSRTASAGPSWTRSTAGGA